MFGGTDKGGMHPEDRRNLFIFFIIAALMYFTFDALVMKPQAEALKAHRIAAATIAKNAPLENFGPPPPREIVVAKETRVEIKNDHIYGGINLRGGTIDDLSLSDYFETIEKKRNVVVLSPTGTTNLPRAIFAGWRSTDASLKLPGPDTVWRAQGNETLTPATPITMTWDNGQGLKFENTFTIDDKFLITLTRKVTNNTGRPVNVSPYGEIMQTGLHYGFAPMWIAHEGPVGFGAGGLQEASYADLRKTPRKEFISNDGWAGITDKYWLTSLMPAQGPEVKYNYSYEGIPPKGREQDKGIYRVTYESAIVTIAPGAASEAISHAFIGPKKVMMLGDYGRALNVPHFDLSVDFGWFWFMTKPFFYLLHFLGEHTPNFGIAIILLTFIIRMAVFPLTNISYTSFARMKKVNPQVMEIRKNYGDDKQKLQQELVKLYEREKVNPMAGCLPMLVQIPIFFSLYKVLVTTIEMRHAPFYGWIHDLTAADPTNIFNLFGLIDWQPWSFLHIGAWPCFLFLAFQIQKKLNPPPQDPIMRDMNMYMPFMMAYLMSTFASGLVIYWTFSAFIGIAQQIFIMKRLGVPVYLFGEEEDAKEMDALVAKGPGVHPMAEMAEKEAEKALFGDGDSGPDDTPRPVVSAPKGRKKKKK
jgi:YidC/Oxa1 family membrane protein insertase